MHCCEKVGSRIRALLVRSWNWISENTSIRATIQPCPLYNDQVHKDRCSAALLQRRKSNIRSLKLT